MSDSPPFSTALLSGFDDPRASVEVWERLLDRNDAPSVFMTRPFLEVWWQTFGTGRLLLVAAERDSEVIALAPFYADDGMIMSIGCGQGDYLDLLGEIEDPDVLTALLRTARDCVADFVGFRLYGLSDRSRSAGRLQEAGARIGLDAVDELEIAAVDVDLKLEGDAVRQAVGRSMLRREEAFRRRGNLEVRRLSRVEDIRPLLPDFYDRHMTRWEAKGIVSPFHDPNERLYIDRLLNAVANTGWLRFLHISWEGSLLAAEFAWYYRGTHFSAPWCFDIEQARHCPGHVLLRQSLLSALDEGLATYDLGIGDQGYKFRLPARTRTCRTVGLYPT